MTFARCCSRTLDVGIVATSLFIVLSISIGGCRRVPEEQLERQIEIAQKAYDKREGSENRGPLFYDLVAILDAPVVGQRHESQKLTRADIVKRLGKPDYVGSGDAPYEMIFTYNGSRAGEELCVFVKFEGRDDIAEFAYSGLDSVDLSKYEEYNADDGSKDE